MYEMCIRLLCCYVLNCFHNARNERHIPIQLLVSYEAANFKSKMQIISEVWRKRDRHLRRVEK